ncbi:MAG TPA: PTS system mannose/fructose/sorbose family transporter subunit IID [Gemmatimonadaceae bacterium]|nr:PTS system mannose/fructose/sorbose family transporter subunit IID [Gemmatimonadaceae bacterium]
MSAPRSATGATPAPTLPLLARLDMFLRLLAIQGAWNYETMLGNGLAFCMEPALKQLPGGRGGAAYRAAMARQSRYFNAHPYLAAVAVGALARAELDGEPPARIERFRTAVCGPLGSCGDRLVWAAWLPLCSLLAIIAWALGAGPVPVVVLFLGLYNAGHLALRAWALHVGLTRGLQVASALAAPWLQAGPEYLGQVGAAAAGLALPIALGRVLGSAHWASLGVAMGGAVLIGLLFVRVQGRWQGWRLALPALALFVLISVIA